MAMLDPTPKPQVNPALLKQPVTTSATAPVTPATSPTSAPTVAAPAGNFTFMQPLGTATQIIKLLLVGDSGGGKTYKAAQFCASGKVVIFNFDQNTVGLARLPKEMQDKIILINPYLDKNGKEYDVKKTWSNFLELLALVVDMPDVTTIIIDSLSTFAAALNWQILGKKDPNAKPAGFDHWAYFMNHLQLFCDKVLHDPNLDKHIILIAHDEVEKNPLTQEVFRSLSLNGQMKNSFPLHFTDVWRVYPKVPTAGPIEYRIRTVPATGYICKCSLDIPDDFVFDKEKDKIISAFKNLSKK